MASRNRASSTSSAADDRRSEQQPRSWPAPAPSRAELASAFSQALDLAEGRQSGHAARVCYIALNLAESVGLSAADQRVVYYSALLHDAGAMSASADVCRQINLTEESIFRASAERSAEQIAREIAPVGAEDVVDALHSHPERGAQVAGALGFDTDVQQAITAHHERWDGRGYPEALEGEAIHAAGRIVGAADLIESLIATEANALTARRNLVSALTNHAGAALDEVLAQRASDLVRSDAFWLGLHNWALPRELPASCPEEPEGDPADLITFASVFADLADTKGEHTGQHSKRTAEYAYCLGEAMAFGERRLEMLRVAALVHDVGLLGIPARIIAKPDILSLAEMETMRKHPTYSQMVLEALPGLEEVAGWAGAHHERPDGKGYPEMMEDTTIPVEARIIAVVDTYVALTSERPYRKALSDKDAQQVLLGGAGGQLDAKLVQLLCSKAPGLMSSRTAPRSRRRR